MLSKNSDEHFLFDRSSAAAAIGISIRSLDYLISTRQVEVRRLGKRVLVPRAELERLASIDRGRMVPAANADDC